MKVLNIHERTFRAGAVEVGALLDSLASAEDRLWPHRIWPAMRFDRPLSPGARGGHGPIRYTVEAFVPGHSVRFRFTGPTGFNGTHGFEVLTAGGGTVVLRHTLSMRTHGLALLTWPIVFRPLHDALIEDALSAAASALGKEPEIRPWSRWVKVLRALFSKGRAAKQPTVAPARGVKRADV